MNRTPSLRDYETAHATATRLGLATHDPHLAMLARTAELPGNLGRHAKQYFATMVEHLTSGGFVRAPADILGQGTINLSRQVCDGAPIRVSMAELATHLHICARTGSGKTAFLDGVQCSLRTAHPMVKHLYMDQKDDWRRKAATDEQCIIISPNTPIAMLQPATGTDREEHFAHIRRCLTKTMYGAHHIESILRQAMDEASTRNPQCGLGDVFDIVRAMRHIKSTYQYLDSVIKTENRGEIIKHLRPGLLAKDGWSINELSAHSLYVHIPRLTTEADLFFFTWLVEELYLIAKTAQDRQALRWVVIMDEAGTLWQANDENRIGSTPYLSETHSRVREYGIGFLTTSTSSIILDPLFRSNTSIQVAMQLNNAAEVHDVSQTMGLSTEQEPLLRGLRIGECIIRIPRWPYPIHGAFDPPTEKTVSPALWSAALQRTAAATPKHEPPTITVTTPATPPRKTIAPQPVTDDNGQDEPTTMPVRLSIAEEALGRHLCKVIIDTVVESYKAADLSPQVGDRAADKLTELAFITRSPKPITIKHGRGGTAIALTPTDRLYERLQLSPPHGLRGGSRGPQHLYLVTRLSQRIPASMIETTLGGKNGKSIDLLIRITEEHERLLAVLREHAQALATPAYEPKREDLLAIEVETTQDHASANAIKNIDAGTALTISAVMPKALKAAREQLARELPTQYHNRCRTIDALTLLEALGE